LTPEILADPQPADLPVEDQRLVAFLSHLLDGLEPICRRYPALGAELSEMFHRVADRPSDRQVGKAQWPPEPGWNVPDED
jgi:hypothetical protein